MTRIAKGQEEGEAVAVPGGLDREAGEAAAAQGFWIEVVVLAHCLGIVAVHEFACNDAANDQSCESGQEAKSDVELVVRVDFVKDGGYSRSECVVLDRVCRGHHP